MLLKLTSYVGIQNWKQHELDLKIYLLMKVFKFFMLEINFLIVLDFEDVLLIHASKFENRKSVE